MKRVEPFFPEDLKRGDRRIDFVQSADNDADPSITTPLADIKDIEFKRKV